MEKYIKNSIDNLRCNYNLGATRSVEFRVAQLLKLKAYIKSRESEILEALTADLGKSAEEGYLTEISMVMGEINYHLKHLKQWTKPQRVATPLHLLPSRSYVLYEPLGVALIVAPWNYPFNLMLTPLVGAISSGCCAILKPSDASAATTALISKMIRELFEPNYIDIVEGSREVNSILFEQRYDIIFFTGSPQLGRIVSLAAAKHLTPVVLELGGKSPCIVDHDANVEIAARRVVWGKFLNCGQTCVAPDYLFVHSSLKESLLQAIVSQIESMYGKNPKESRFYTRIINDQAFDRVTKLIEGESIFYGGDSDRVERYISPTILDGVSKDSPIMEEEIFGPLLPILTFDSLEELYTYINSQPRPLALYYFGQSGSEVLQNCTSGGACINDTIMQLTNHHLPFGGVGNSGSGRYHGKDSFTAFSSRRAVVVAPTWIDLPFKYVPFKLFNFIKRFI